MTKWHDSRPVFQLKLKIHLEGTRESRATTRRRNKSILPITAGNRPDLFPSPFSPSPLSNPPLSLSLSLSFVSVHTAYTFICPLNRFVVSAYLSLPLSRPVWLPSSLALAEGNALIRGRYRSTPCTTSVINNRGETIHVGGGGRVIPAIAWKRQRLVGFIGGLSLWKVYRFVWNAALGPDCRENDLVKQWVLR